MLDVRDVLVGLTAAGALYLGRFVYIFLRVYSFTKAVPLGGAIRPVNTPLFWLALALTASAGFAISRYFRLLA